MRIAFVAKNESLVPQLYSVFTKAGHTIQNPPEVIVVVGGDGTLLRAERTYPGIPKALIKDSAVGNLYEDHTAQELASALLKNDYYVEERVALEASVHSNTYRAANDVIIRNKFLTHAIRFSLTIDKEKRNGEYIGDGVVVSTPTGSSGYYYSITKKTFSEGIGIAFNNLHNIGANQDCISGIDEEAEITIEITRGPADIGVDNSLHIEELQAGDSIRIKKSSTPLRIIRIQE